MPSLVCPHPTRELPDSRARRRLGERGGARSGMSCEPGSSSRGSGRGGPTRRKRRRWSGSGGRRLLLLDRCSKRSIERREVIDLRNLGDLHRRSHGGAAESLAPRASREEHSSERYEPMPTTSRPASSVEGRPAGPQPVTAAYPRSAWPCVGCVPSSALSVTNPFVGAMAFRLPPAGTGRPPRPRAPASFRRAR